MSAIITSLVWETDLPRPEKFVLLAYASFASHDGTCIFSSQERIARMTAYSKRSVRRLTRTLEAKGYLFPVAENRGGRGRTNRWRIPLKDDALSPVPPDPSMTQRVGMPSAKADKGDTNPDKWDEKADETPASTPQPLKPDAVAQFGSPNRRLKE